MTDPRVVQAGRDLLRFPRPSPLLKQGQVQQVPRALSGWGLNISRNGHSITPPAVLAALQTALTAKKSSLVCTIMPTNSSL